MSAYSDTCVDSSVLVYSIGPKPSSRIRALWREWLQDKVMLHAPSLLRFEVVNALYQQQKAGLLAADDASRALKVALDRPIVLHEDNELHTRALELASKFMLPAAYDAQYLALAERLGVEFWTADAKLVKAVAGRLAWVRLVS